MASTGNAKMITSTNDDRIDSEKAVQLESAPGSETERDMEDARERVSGDKTDDATELQDAGPPDGGTAAWLVVLGAWCCSFCSPGWINSTCFLFRMPEGDIHERHNGLTTTLSYQAWALSRSTTRSDLCTTTPAARLPGFLRSSSSSCSAWGPSSAESSTSTDRDRSSLAGPSCTSLG